MMAWDDVALDLFGVAGDSSGSIQVIADTARWWSPPAPTTSATWAPSASSCPESRSSETLTSGEIGVLSLLSNNAAFRTNVGFINLGDAAGPGAVTVYNASGRCSAPGT